MTLLDRPVVQSNVVPDHLKRAVTQDALECHRISTVHQVIHRESVPQTVWMNAVDTGAPGEPAKDLAVALCCQGPTSVGHEQRLRPGLRTVDVDIAPQSIASSLPYG